MSPFEYLKKKKKVVHAAVLIRRPSYVVDAEQILSEISLQRTEEKGGGKNTGKRVLLQTEDEIFLRTKEFERIHNQGRTGTVRKDMEAVNILAEDTQEGEDAFIEDKENHEGL